MKRLKIVKLASIALGVTLSLFAISLSIFAFTGPSQSPPSCPSGEPGCDAPLHVGIAAQVKDGPLGVEGTIRGYSSMIIDGRIGIGTEDPAKKVEIVNSGLKISGTVSIDEGADDPRLIVDSGASTSHHLVSLRNSLGEVMRVTGSNVGIGTATPSKKLHVAGDVLATAFYYSSDIRLKENVAPLSNSLEKILKLNGIRYSFKESGEEGCGFSAQEVKEVFPEVVGEDDEGMLSINSSGLIAHLVEAIKELQREIQEQGEMIELLKEEITSMKNS